MFETKTFMVRISNLDILALLKKNSRMPFTQMAKTLKVSETAIRKRIKKMEEKGIIQAYSIELNPKKAGFNVNALIGVDTKPESLVTIIEKLKKMPETISIFTASGDHMILIECLFKTYNEFTNFIKKIESLQGIIKVCPAIKLEKIK
jgi:Lrp/AsnC family transcriptional regulator for asnA, asnC and gidA